MLKIQTIGIVAPKKMWCGGTCVLLLCYIIRYGYSVVRAQLLNVIRTIDEQTHFVNVY